MTKEKLSKSDIEYYKKELKGHLQQIDSYKKRAKEEWKIIREIQKQLKFMKQDEQNYINEILVANNLLKEHDDILQRCRYEIKLNRKWAAEESSYLK